MHLISLNSRPVDLTLNGVEEKNASKTSCDDFLPFGYSEAFFLGVKNISMRMDSDEDEKKERR